MIFWFKLIDNDVKVWWCIYSYICLCPRYIMWICRNGVVLYKIIFLRKWISRMQRRKRKRRRRQKDIFMQRIFAHCTSSSSHKLCIYAFLYMLVIWWNEVNIKILHDIIIYLYLFNFNSMKYVLVLFIIRNFNWIQLLLENIIRVIT